MEQHLDRGRSPMTSSLTPYPGALAEAEARALASGPGDVTAVGAVALVLAILPVIVTWPVALVLATWALHRSRPGAPGRGVAVAALLLPCAWVALMVVLLLAHDPAYAT